MGGYFWDILSRTLGKTLAAYGQSPETIAVSVFLAALHWVIPRYRQGGLKAVMSLPATWRQKFKEVLLSIGVGGGIVLIVLIPINILRSTYESELNKVQEALQRRLLKPELRGVIDFAMTGELSRTDCPAVSIIMVATIYNTGVAPTIVERYRLTVEFPGGNQFPDLLPQTLPDKTIWKAGKLGGASYQFFGSDSLAVKTAEHPITGGGSAKGVLLFLLPEVESEILDRVTKVKFRLSFMDVNGEKWLSLPKESNMRAPGSFGFPGLKSGILPKYH